uniref:Uncharacterized protein n=1 Tax=Pan paniscus TaxID=9597 RepID=A0A2R8ZL86_PANPA
MCKEDMLDYDGSNSFATDLSSGTINHKKYIKFSKTIEKKISPEIRSLSPEYKKILETSIILCGEEKSSDFSGEKKVGRKSLQVQQHSKRTEIIPPFLKLSKEKVTRKENSLCKLPNQYSVHKTSSPLCTSSAITRYLNPCTLFFKCWVQTWVFPSRIIYPFHIKNMK